MKRIVVFLMAVLLLLTAAGCGPNPPDPPKPPETPETPEPETDVRISSPMPPSAGLSVPEGKMLWPIRQEMGAGFFKETVKYGFLNEKGEPVIPVQYTDYSYEKDSEGRYRYLIAGDTERIDIYTLDGEKILEIAAESARFISGTSLIVARRYTGTTFSDSRMLLFDFDSGKQILKKEYTDIEYLTGNILLAVDPQQREYLIDLEKGEDGRIPLEGNTYGYDFAYGGSESVGMDFRLAAEDPRITVDYGEGILPRYGYLGPDGKWAIEPVYFSVEPFEGDVARVEIAKGDYRYIDRQGSLTGTALSPQEEYNSKNGWHDGVFYYGGKVIEGLPSYCDWIPFADGPVVVAASRTDYEKWYFLNTETGVGREMESLGAIWRFRDWYVGWGGSKVYDVNGNELTDTLFHRYPSAGYFTMHIADEPYLWVTTARYQGYVNPDGEWLYRESRFGWLLD